MTAAQGPRASGDAAGADAEAADAPSDPREDHSAVVLVIGDLEATRATCALLSRSGFAVTHLAAPTDVEVRSRLDGPDRQDPQAVVIVVRSDIQALRYALLTEHVRPGIDLVVSLFDKTVAEQLAAVVPHCATVSPAAAAAASIVAGVTTDDGLCLLRAGHGYEVLARPNGGPSALGRRPWDAAGTSWRGRLSAILPRPMSGSSAMMLAGLAGLVTILVADWALSAAVLGEPALEALYVATRIVATVGPADAVGAGSGVAAHPPGWYLVVASAFMAAALVLTAMFVAGVVDWLMSGRTVGLIGRRAVPRRDHVVVAGLGQVGLRAAMLLRRLGVPVVVIERDPSAPNLRLAREARIPVVVGHAEDRATLRRVNIGRARGLATLGSDELDNVAIAITARAVAPTTRIVLRAGEDDIVAETRSLFRIGRVVDVPALMAVSAMLAVQRTPTEVVFGDGPRVGAVTDDGLRWFRPTDRCSCTAS